MQKYPAQGLTLSRSSIILCKKKWTKVQGLWNSGRTRTPTSNTSQQKSSFEIFSFSFYLFYFISFKCTVHRSVRCFYTLYTIPLMAPSRPWLCTQLCSLCIGTCWSQFQGLFPRGLPWAPEPFDSILPCIIVWTSLAFILGFLTINSWSVRLFISIEPGTQYMLSKLPMICTEFRWSQLMWFSVIWCLSSLCLVSTYF